MVVGRAGGFAKRRQSVATSANRPTPRRAAAAAAAAQSGKPKQRKSTPQNRQQQQQNPSPDPKSSEAEASSSSAPPTTTRTASTSKAKLSSDSLLTGAPTISAPIKRKDATVNRRSVDFSKIVLEAARRASNTTAAITGNNRRGTTTDSSDIEAAGASAGINFEKIIRDRKSKLLHRQPSIEEVAETESTVSIVSAFNLAKQHSLNSPRRRRVTDISDYKTCALLMENMKVAGRGSPQ